MGNNLIRDYDILDTLAILSTVLQLRNYQAELQSADNDDIMHELQKQNKEYLEEILKNQRLILEKLDRLSPN